MRKQAAAGIVVVVMSGLAARAEGAFTGADAAIIDWGVKNCGMKSTDAEHVLVDAANAKGRDAFSRQYMQQFESALFKEAANNREKQTRLCRDVKEWYGKEGTRIPKLLAGEGEATVSTTGRSPSAAPRAPSAGGSANPLPGRRF